MQVLQVQLEVGPDPAEVGRARRWARSRLAGSGIGDDEPLAETLVLLISELVTNAVVHTGCPAVLRMLFAAEGSGVRVEVADASDRPPRPRHAEGDDTNGRGLELVDGLADRWGWQPEGAGKSIWCEVDRVAPVSTTVSTLSPGRVHC
ncbi:ATP-binding protein [Streptomyces sp. NPDC015661]|uniref:ATP-binding protein n=1 Tax=Streptomyces sp. NPDC015661 TaxID=3364961 RepID=UPI0036F4DEA5